jgi:rod shape-determining protein MreD
MIGTILQNLLRFLLLVFIQVFILNQITLPGNVNAYINPNIYILFLFMLPININKQLLLLLSFICGLTIDVFSSTAGMHASACLFIGLMRPGLVNLIMPRDGYENTVELTLPGLGFRTFFIYTSTLVVLHHFVLYLIEAFNFLNFGDLLLRVIISSIAALFLITLSQLLTLRKR